MARENIIARIKKLLALASDNPSASEATAAALMAQKLIVDNDVSKDELYEDEPEEISEVEGANVIGKPWAMQLAQVIADNFRCQHFYNSKMQRTYWGRKRTNSRKPVFVGYETDAEAARVTFDKLYEIGERLADAECRRQRSLYGTAAGVRNSFLVGDGTNGYVGGIRSELEKQSRELMLVRRKEVDDYYDERTAGCSSLRSNIRGSYDGEAASRGYEAGRDSLRSARIAGRAALGA